MGGRALKADAHIALPTGSLSAHALRLQSSVRANARDTQPAKQMAMQCALATLHARCESPCRADAKHGSVKMRRRRVAAQAAFAGGPRLTSPLRSLAPFSPTSRYCQRRARRRADIVAYVVFADRPGCDRPAGTARLGRAPASPHRLAGAPKCARQSRQSFRAQVV